MGARRRTRVLAAHLAGAAAATAEESPDANDTAEKRLQRGKSLPFEPLVHSAEDSLPGAFGIELTPDEIEQFRTQGWIVKRGLIPKEELAPWVETAWNKVESIAPVSRDDPESWLDPATRWAITQNKNGERSQSADGELSANSEWRWHHVGHDEAFLAATSAHPNVLRVVESLCGGPVRVPNRNRGIYFIFPRSHQEKEGLPIQAQLGPHLDATSAQVQAAIYLDEVGPHAGGFTLWPTSPQQLYPCMRQHHNFTPTEDFGPTLKHIKQSVVPIEFAGGVGDVILYHHLAVHSTGINTSQRVRIGSIHDYQRVQPPAHLSWTAVSPGGAAGAVEPREDGLPMAPEYLASGREAPEEFREADASEISVGQAWFVDTMEFGPTDPIKEDMWEDWNFSNNVSGQAVRQESFWDARGIAKPWEGMPKLTLDEAHTIGAHPSLR